LWAIRIRTVKEGKPGLAPQAPRQAILSMRGILREASKRQTDVDSLVG
jgi:hypothetical protein